MVELIVHAHNNGAQDEIARVGLLIGPIPHIALGEVSPFDVPAGGDGTAQITITVPLLPAGSYMIDLLSDNGPLTSGTLIVKIPVGA
jgi:hypothetical protein